MGLRDRNALFELPPTFTLYARASPTSSVSVVDFGRGDSESDSDEFLDRVVEMSGLQAEAGVTSCGVRGCV